MRDRAQVRNERRGRRLLVRVLLLGVGLITIAGALAFFTTRWRVDLIAMKASGSLPEVAWLDVGRTLAGGGHFHAPTLLETGDPDQAFRNPMRRSEEDRAAGMRLFRRNCASCHGLDGSGATGPALTRGLTRADNDHALVSLISDGIPGTAMSRADLPTRDVWRIAAYVREISGGRADRAFTTEPSAGVLPPELAIQAPRVTSQRLADAATEPHNWLTYSGTYESHRHTSLRQIHRGNVARLGVAWVYQMPTELNAVQTTPLVVDGIMYATEPPAAVVALDASTGRRLWRYEWRLPDDLRLCCGLVNRGLAVLGDRVYMGTLDAKLIALDATTGQLVWTAEVADYRQGHSITGAVLSVEDKIIVGISGGLHGIRGFLDAFYAETGERAWRFYTVPGPGEPGHETWGGDSWRTGGAPTWTTGSYDPDLNLLYWGVGNPGPPWDGSDRPGDNLYANSVIALDLDSGGLVWHFQFTPHDEHDWDATQVPVLFDAEYGGENRRLMAWPNRNAFYYLLDRETGEFLLAREFATQTWALGIDETGRPIRAAGTRPTPEGTVVSPSALGATNWWPRAFNPATGLVYVPVIPESAHLFRSEPSEYVPGRIFLGGGIERVSDEPAVAAIRALDAITGETRWTFRLPDRVTGDPHRVGGVLSTAGGIVFGGSGGTFVAVDAERGEELWRMGTGGTIMAGPISYEVDGTQYVAVAAGRGIFAFTLL